jgi:dUTPase
MSGDAAPIQFSSTEAIPLTRLPSRGTPGSAGLDLFLPCDAAISPQETAYLDHRVTFLFPRGYYGQLHLRSSAAGLGLSLKGGVIGECLDAVLIGKANP